MRQNLELLEMTSPPPLNIIRSMSTVVLSLDYQHFFFASGTSANAKVPEYG